MGYIGMCEPKEHWFSAVLVIKRVSILADFGHKLGMFLRSDLFIIKPRGALHKLCLR